MQQVAIILVLLVCAGALLALLYFSYKLLKKTQQQELLERGSQPAPEYKLHPKLQKEQQRGQNRQADEEKDPPPEQ